MRRKRLGRYYHDINALLKWQEWLYPVRPREQTSLQQAEAPNRRSRHYVDTIADEELKLD